MADRVFDIGRLIVGFGWAKSLLWGTTSAKGEHRTYLFSLHIVSKDGLKALSFILGPVYIIASLKK